MDSPLQPSTVTLDCERFLLRSIVSSAADGCVHTKSSWKTAVINEKEKWTFLNDLKRLTQSLVSRTAPSSMDIHTVQPNKQAILPLPSVPCLQQDSGDTFSMVTAIGRAHMTDLEPHADAIKAYPFVAEARALSASSAPEGPPVQPESTSLPKEAILVVAHPTVESDPHRAVAMQPSYPTVANLKPSAFAEATSHPFDTESMARSPPVSHARMPGGTPHDPHMTFLSDVELDATDSVGARTGGGSPLRTQPQSDAAAIDNINQRLQRSSAVNLLQCTPAGTVEPSTHSHPAAWGNAASSDAGCSVLSTGDVVSSLIASGMELFTPPPLFLGVPQTAYEVIQPLQQIKLPPGPTLPHPTTASSGGGYIPQEKPAQSACIDAAATTATYDTFFEPMPTPVAPQLPNGNQESPLMRARTPRRKFAAPVVAHRNVSEAPGDKHVQIPTVTHGNGPPLVLHSPTGPSLPSPSFASEAPSSCATHVAHATPGASDFQPASDLHAVIPPSCAQGNSNESSIRAQHSVHAVRATYTHATPMASRLLHAAVPLNDALANAIMMTSDNRVLSSMGSLNANTPSYKRPGYAQNPCSESPLYCLHERTKRKLFCLPDSTSPVAYSRLQLTTAPTTSCSTACLYM